MLAMFRSRSYTPFPEVIILCYIMIIVLGANDVLWHLDFT